MGVEAWTPAGESRIAPYVYSKREDFIIDLTWASPVMERAICDWRVAEEETASDHKYILFRVASKARPPDEAGPRRRNANPSPRWRVGALNEDALMAAALVAGWSDLVGSVEVEEEVEWFRGAMTRICDFAMPRTTALIPWRRVY